MKSRRNYSLSCQRSFVKYSFITFLQIGKFEARQFMTRHSDQGLIISPWRHNSLMKQGINSSEQQTHCLQKGIQLSSELYFCLLLKSSAPSQICPLVLKAFRSVAQAAFRNTCSDIHIILVGKKLRKGNKSQSEVWVVYVMLASLSCLYEAQWHQHSPSKCFKIQIYKTQ